MLRILIEVGLIVAAFAAGRLTAPADKGGIPGPKPEKDKGNKHGR